MSKRTSARGRTRQSAPMSTSAIDEIYEILDADVAITNAYRTLRYQRYLLPGSRPHMIKYITEYFSSLENKLAILQKDGRFPDELIKLSTHYQNSKRFVYLYDTATKQYTVLRSEEDLIDGIKELVLFLDSTYKSTEEVSQQGGRRSHKPTSPKRDAMKRASPKVAKSRTTRTPR